VSLRQKKKNEILASRRSHLVTTTNTQNFDAAQVINLIKTAPTEKCQTRQMELLLQLCSIDLNVPAAHEACSQCLPELKQIAQLLALPTTERAIKLQTCRFLVKFVRIRIDMESIL
jgi:hypothetical protein